MGEKTDLRKLHSDLKNIRKTLENYKAAEINFEKSRLLKMIDAELMDALYNLENLLELSEKESE